MTDLPPPRKPAPLFHPSLLDHHIPGFQVPPEASPPVSRPILILSALAALAAAFLGWTLEHLGHNAPTPDVPLAWSLPFILLLISIAAMPFLARRFWEHNYHWVSLSLGTLVAVYYIFFLHAGPRLAANLADYISFIFLLGSLFVVSGGILIRIRRQATPLVNLSLLLAGAILSNILGTTGASMLLVRPYLHINKGHIRPYHIVFFIFIVSNVGGCLTPIGDPPLFLGYLKGVPFFWVLQHCWPAWSVAIAALLAVFFIFDTLAHHKQPRAPRAPDDPGPPVSLFGAANLLFLALILIAVFLDPPFREILMAAAALASLLTTSHRIHYANVFNFAPIKEVALLFLGIFATLVPALNYLSLHVHDPALRPFLQSPGQLYYASGTLSSILDSAPAYLAFFQLQSGKLDQNLLAISLGTVFFGALTYLGNGPNFMVKSIAENAGGGRVNCPSFLAYILLYSLPILLPILILIHLLFL